MIWDDVNVERLRAMWGKRSATEIGREFGCTGNAVIGKAHRLGLEPLQDGRKPTGAGSRGPTVPRRTRTVYCPDYVSVAEAEANLPPTDDPFGPDGCRWVIGDPIKPGARFCQHKRTDGSFCSAHATIAYRRESASVSRR